MSEQSKPHLTFRHLRLPWVSSSATITAAIRIDKNAGKADVAFSFCSPDEKRFHKRVGRRIAETRLDGDRCVHVKLFDPGSTETAVACGLKGALVQRFVAKKEHETAKPFTHWVPNWLMRSVNAFTVENTALGEDPDPEKTKAQVFVIVLLHHCSSAYERHLKEVKERRERDARKSNTGE